MKKMATRLMMAAALVLIAVAPAAAQNEVGVGLVSEHWNGCCARGLGVDFAHAITSTEDRSMSVIADFGYNRWAGEETDTSVVGGVRWRFMRSSRVGYFFQATAGIMHWSEDAVFEFPGDSGSDFIAGGGAGLQIKVNDLVDVKGQVDIWYDSGDMVRRYFIAAVIKLGNKK